MCVCAQSLVAFDALHTVVVREERAGGRYSAVHATWHTGAELHEACSD